MDRAPDARAERPLAWALGLAALALLVRLPLLLGRNDAAAGSDSTFYLQLADDIAGGDGFQEAGRFYMPGYPFAMFLARVVPGRTEDAMAVAQHLVGIGLVVAVVLLGARWFGRVPAVAAGALVALTPLVATLEHLLLADFLFGALVVAGAFALAEASCRERPPPLLLVAVGVSFGAATWVKPAGQFLLIAAPVALLFATRDWRATLRGAAIVTGVMVLAVSPWMVRNTRQYGDPLLSNQGGQTLFNRVFEVDKLPFPRDSRYSELEPAARAEDGRFNTNFRVALVREGGLTVEEALDVERDIALTAIRRHPARYAAGTARETWRAADDLRSFDYETTDLRDELEREGRVVPVQLSTVPWAGSRVLVLAWWVLTLGGATALVLPFAGSQRSRRAAVALLSVWLAVAVGTALTHGALWRYSMQVAAIGWLLGAAGTVTLAGEIRRRRAARPTRPHPSRSGAA